MPTIISNEKRFAFIHIPKCAGTSLARQIQSVVTYEPGFGGEIREHPAIGTYYDDHRTLAELLLTAPAALEKIRRYDAVAVCRDPIERFRSALAQVLRNRTQQALYELSRSQLAGFVDEIVTGLRQRDFRPLHMSFFHRQTDYVYLEGERVVRHLFDIRDLDGLTSFLRDRFAIDIGNAGKDRDSAEHAWTRVLRDRRYRPVIDLLRRVLPRGVVQALRRRGRAVVSRTAQERIAWVLEDAGRGSFLRDFYADDYDLLKLAAGKSAARAS